jgi:hypothetical protein
MGNNQSNTTDITTSVMTSIFEETSTTCSATCSETQSGNVVVIQNSTIGGSAGFAESCSVSASCMMNNSLDAEVQNIISSTLEQENEAITDFMNGLSVNNETNSANINQYVYNSVTQIIDSTCNASLAFSQTNNLLYISDSGVGGFAGFQIGIDQPASANASCSMSNMSKSVVYNSVQDSTTQSNTSMGSMALIAAAIIACIVLGGILLLATGVLKSSSGKGGSQGSLTPQQQGNDYEMLMDFAKENPDLTKAAVSGAL